MVQETISTWFARIALLTVSMVRVSCILLLHVAFSSFIVAERLASDYDAWDDSEENTTISQKEKDMEDCSWTKRKPKSLLKCLEGHFMRYSPRAFERAEGEPGFKCYRSKSEDASTYKSIDLTGRKVDVNPCAHLGPVVVEVTSSEIVCWTYYWDPRHNLRVNKQEFMNCFDKTKSKPKPLGTGATEAKVSSYFWGKNWSP